MKFIKSNLKYLAAAIMLALMLVMPLAVSAKGDRVVDNLDILSESEESALEAKLDRLSDEYGHDIAVVTTDTLDGKNVKLYADDYYDFNGYGKGDDDSGILLLIYINPSNSLDRQYAISTCGRAVNVFTENDLTSLEDAFLDDLSSGNYSDAFNAYADKCAYIIKYDNRLPPVWILIALAVGAAVGGITIYSMCSKYKSVRAQKGANSYMRRDTFHLDRSRDVYLYSHVTRRVRPQNNSSSSGGGRSIGSSGRSHGGRSGRF